MAQTSVVTPFVSPVQVYTAQEVAAILKVSTRSVERLVSSHKLGSIHVGRRIRVTADQLHAYLHQECVSQSRGEPAV